MLQSYAPILMLTIFSTKMHSILWSCLITYGPIQFFLMLMHCGVKWVSALFLICLLMMERLMFLQLLRPSGRWGVSNLPTCDVVHFRRTILECLTPSQVPLYQMICLFHKLNRCCKLTLGSCCLSLIGCTIFQFSHWKYQK